VHWHYRNNGAARLFGGEQNAQGAGEEASSWRDRSVGVLCSVVDGFLVWSGLVWSYELRITVAVGISVEMAIHNTRRTQE
jgi:hypothetical protein